jgi:hypothetical protein
MTCRKGAVWTMRMSPPLRQLHLTAAPMITPIMRLILGMPGGGRSKAPLTLERAEGRAGTMLGRQAAEMDKPLTERRGHGTVRLHH